MAFEDVNLREASFMETQLTSVSFTGCDLVGADFRGARVKDCTIRGASLDEVVGVESLRGLRMPWSDLVGSVAALAAALGIGVEGSEAGIASGGGSFLRTLRSSSCYHGSIRR